jgi:zinc D-Ala-D-Ala dipeptidase
VDVWLCDPNGAPLSLSDPFDPEDPASFALDARGLSAEVRLRRDRLRDALLRAGLSNYPCEYWHWSFGDQGWAYRGGQAWAVYGAIDGPNQLAR